MFSRTFSMRGLAGSVATSISQIRLENNPPAQILRRSSV